VNFSYKAVIQYFIHFPLFYLSLFLILVIIISLILKQDIRQVTAVASIGMGLILCVPIIDWIISGGYLITYPLRLKPFFANFLNPAKSLASIGVSPGQRIIIVFISLLVAVYAYLKRKKLAISFSLLIITLGIILIWGALPTIIALDKPENIYLTGGILNTDQQKFAAIFGILFLFVLFIYYYRLNKGYFRILIKSLRLERMLFYGSIGIFGYVLAIHQQGINFTPDFFNLIGIILLVLSLAFGFQAAQVINDFFDIESDKISRKRNPLLKDIPRNYCFIWGINLILISLSFTLIINYTSFLLMTGYLLLSVIYSVPPVRLKRIPVISTFILALATIIAMGIGFSLIYGSQALNVIPKIILIPTILGVTFGFIAKDIQDLKSDRISDVITIPILIYKDTIFGRLPVAILIGISYLFYAVFIPKVLLGAVICTLITILYTIFIRNNKEWFYFLLLYIFGFYLLLVLLKISL
jgi:4-hydroxybenzoate polyprenyltransferase